MRKILAIANPKGGVSKTTTAFSLAGVLAERGHKVLMIDLDPQMGLTSVAGVGDNNGSASIDQAFFDHRPLDQLIVRTANKGIDLIPGSTEMMKLEKSFSDKVRYALKGLLKDAAFDYTAIVIDTPPFYGALTANAIIASQILVIPSLSEYLSLESLSGLIKRLEYMRVRENRHLVYRILLTMYNPRNKVHSKMRELISKNATQVLFNSIIPVDTKLSESQLHGEPISMYAPNSPSGRAYRELLDELEQIYVLSPNIY